MRANMTMTNAQAALIAAANSAVRGSAVPVEPVLKRAASYLSWLDSQDETKVARVSFDKPVVHKAAPITQCKTVSKAGTRCLLADKHALPHRNSQDGVTWGPAEPTLPGVELTHFYTGLDSAYAPCGQFMQNATPVTAFIDHVTCIPCKVALGL